MSFLRVNISLSPKQIPFDRSKKDPVGLTSVQKITFIIEDPASICLIIAAYVFVKGCINMIVFA